MKPWRRPILQRVLVAIREAFAGPVPVAHRGFDPAESRDRQKWAAVAAAFTPVTPQPRLERGAKDRGFQ